MVWLLHNSRTIRLNAIINDIIVYSFETGSLTWLVPLATIYLAF
jgi:hypothetical protein